MTPNKPLCTAAVAGLLVLAGCSGGSASGSTRTTAGSVATTVTTASSTSAAGASSPTTAASATTKKVSANNASIAELQGAFEADGISNASRWAREVDEYRPYPNDPNLPKLRQELAKYNPGPGVVDQIVAALSLP
jgi:hypothetical protein